MLDREPSGHTRSAFTLVELLVALVLVDVGLLAIAGTGARIARESGLAARRAAAIALAQSRVERLAASACPGVPAGEATLSAVLRARWRVEADTAGGSRALTVTVEYSDGARWRTLTISSRAPC